MDKEVGEAQRGGGTWGLREDEIGEVDKRWDEDENLPALFSAAENTDKMAAAMLSAALSQSFWLLLLVHL